MFVLFTYSVVNKDLTVKAKSKVKNLNLSSRTPQCQGLRPRTPTVDTAPIL